MRPTTVAALGALAVGGGPPLLELVGAGSWGIVSVLVGLCAALVMPIALVAAIFSRWRRPALTTAAGAVLIVASCFVGFRLQGAARRAAFQRLAERSMVLVNAIASFERANGRPPAALEEIVPRYIDHIPWTDLPAYRKYEYEVPGPTKERAFHWYDLGSRNGRAFRGLWKYRDGPPENAILVLLTDSDERVVSAELDRVSEDVGAGPFVTSAWSSMPRQRQDQAITLVQEKALIGKTLADIRAMLGAPDESRQLPAPAWELRVDAGRGFLNWDVFFYWPGHDYPKYIYGGSVERIGDWAYVHE